MAKQPNSSLTTTTTDRKAPSKRDLQRQIGRTRESLTQTVDEIKETAEQGYASVKQTVSGVLDYREEFEKEPLVWSLGALSAGFALGYTVGYAHKSAKKGQHSQVAKFADHMVDELSKVGQSLVMPALGAKIKDFLGIDFADLLKSMGGGSRSKNRSGRNTRRIGSKAKKSTKRKKRG